ncbi:glutathione S-transferase family protein [Aureimonas populi]|uniref:Glutathione S-transferase family protein n=1 Tax=Aureimonas populi TaxID=1701758 RepID=A0ABW5CIQ8_9HYPH|nr:glutathione S-transferase family protein [Aureimonas populi]
MPGAMKFYYNPQSRAAIVRWMLEEVGADYETVRVDFEAGDNRKSEFLKLNPMGKIPMLVLEDGTVLTECPAIIAWLADAYPQAGLAPEPGSPERGAYYRWLFFGGSCFEPSMTEAMMRKDQPPLPRSMVGWGTYEDVVRTLDTALCERRYLVCERFTAADLYLGAQLGWAMSFGAPKLKETASIRDYVARLQERPAYRRSMPG